MTSITPATHRAGFAIGDEHAAKRVVDVLTEIFFDGQAAVAAFERPDGRWDVTCILPIRPTRRGAPSS